MRDAALWLDERWDGELSVMVLALLRPPAEEETSFALDAVRYGLGKRRSLSPWGVTDGTEGGVRCSPANGGEAPQSNSRVGIGAASRLLGG
jgi:hypothetical protein